MYLNKFKNSKIKVKHTAQTDKNILIHANVILKTSEFHFYYMSCKNRKKSYHILFIMRGVLLSIHQKIIQNIEFPIL